MYRIIIILMLTMILPNCGSSGGGSGGSGQTGKSPGIILRDVACATKPGENAGEKKVDISAQISFLDEDKNVSDLSLNVYDITNQSILNPIHNLVVDLSSFAGEAEGEINFGREIPVSTSVETVMLQFIMYDEDGNQSNTTNDTCGVGEQTGTF